MEDKLTVVVGGTLLIKVYSPTDEPLNQIHSKLKNGEYIAINSDNTILDTKTGNIVAGVKQRIYPVHGMVYNWGFNEGEEEEARLCNAMAEVAKKNGLDGNDLTHLFPAVLRMLKSDIEWSK